MTPGTENRVDSWIESEAGQRMVERLDALRCKCRHRYSQHDPEDGECDAGAGLGKCRCRCFRSPDPNLTTNQYRLRAALTDEKCGECGGTGQWICTAFACKGNHDCSVCAGSGSVSGERLIPESALEQVTGEPVPRQPYVLLPASAGPFYRLTSSPGDPK